MHYKFNRRLDSAFWRHAREATDVSGAARVLELFRNNSPLRFRDPGLMDQAPHFYGIAGTDAILLGQDVETHVMPEPDLAAWVQRRDRVATAVSSALTMREALALNDLERLLPFGRPSPATASHAVV